MAILLHIIAHPTPETSQTVRIAHALLERYREAHPDDEVQVLDLYQEYVPHLSAAHLSAILKQGQPDTMSDEEHRAWDDFMGRITQFTAADTLVVTTPMWNFGAPSILKAYVDHIMLAGYTFRFTGPGASVGMMAGKRAVIVNTRGGIYSLPQTSAHERCVSFLTDVFDFMGIEVVDAVIAEGLALVGPHEQESIIQQAMQRAVEVATTL